MKCLRLYCYCHGAHCYSAGNVTFAGEERAAFFPNFVVGAYNGQGAPYCSVERSDKLSLHVHCFAFDHAALRK